MPVRTQEQSITLLTKNGLTLTAAEQYITYKVKMMEIYIAAGETQAFAEVYAHNEESAFILLIQSGLTPMVAQRYIDLQLNPNLARDPKLANDAQAIERDIYHSGNNNLPDKVRDLLNISLFEIGQAHRPGH